MEESNGIVDTDKIDFGASRIRFTDETEPSTVEVSPETPSSPTSNNPRGSLFNAEPLLSSLRRLSNTLNLTTSTTPRSNEVPNKVDSSSQGLLPGNHSGNPASRNDAQRSLKTYFAFRDGGHAIANAVKECLPVITDTSDREGNIIGIWLLTEISHWDVEYERLVFLTDRTMIIVKYDLIQLTLLEYRRIPLHLVNRCIYGPLRYPPGSIFEDRNQTGLRISWENQAEASAATVWNPFSEVPFVTFVDHSAAEASPEPSLQGSGITSCLLDNFLQQFTLACRAETEAHHSPLRYEETPILIENYAGLVSRVFNKAQLGFFKSRGRICF